LRIYRHEISHICFSLSAINDSVFENHDKIKEMTRDKVSRVKNDMKQSINILKNHIDNISILIAPSIMLGNDIRKEYLDFQKLFEYIKTVFGNDLFFKNISVKLIQPEKTLSTTKINYQLVKQILFNLFSLAIENSYYNTNIYILLYENKISITYYGDSIEWDNAYNKEAIAVGLFISKKIALGINANINYSCCLVSKYCVPVILHIHNELASINIAKDVISKIEEEINILTDNDMIKKIIPNKMVTKSYSSYYCSRMFSKCTYEVTFMFHFK
jgi:hypothetical protein